MTRFKVNAFPSIYLLKDGRTWVYSGPRNVESVRLFCLSHTRLLFVYALGCVFMASACKNTNTQLTVTGCLHLLSTLHPLTLHAHVLNLGFIPAVQEVCNQDVRNANAAAVLQSAEQLRGADNRACAQVGTCSMHPMHVRIRLRTLPCTGHEGACVALFVRTTRKVADKLAAADGRGVCAMTLPLLGHVYGLWLCMQRARADEEGVPHLAARARLQRHHHSAGLPQHTRLHWRGADLRARCRLHSASPAGHAA